MNSNTHKTQRFPLDIKATILNKYEKYKTLYTDYKDLLKYTITDLQQLSFYEALERNKTLNDRIMMYYMDSEREVTDIKTLDEYKTTQHHITITNIYTITQALYDKKKSFILPIPLLRDLQNLNHEFATTTEALEYVIRWESGK